MIVCCWFLPGTIAMVGELPEGEDVWWPSDVLAAIISAERLIIEQVSRRFRHCSARLMLEGRRGVLGELRSIWSVQFWRCVATTPSYAIKCIEGCHEYDNRLPPNDSNLKGLFISMHSRWTLRADLLVGVVGKKISHATNRASFC